jgi:hypothetical protein
MTAISRAKTIDEGTQKRECTQSALPMQETEDKQVQKKRRTWRDFYAADNREERAAILQELYQGVLTAEEVEEILNA